MARLKLLLASLLFMGLIIACDNSAEPGSVREPEPVDAAVVPDSIEAATVNLALVYTIIPGESVARFELDEEILSANTGWGAWSQITVKGDTDQVFGDIIFDGGELANAQLDSIRINADTFYTVEFWRKRAIQNDILETETYPFITFDPTELRNMPLDVEIGEEVSFQINGDLTIKDISLPQTFEVTALLNSADEIVGSASTVVTRESYQLEIPRIPPHVQNIEDEVELYIDFVARAQPDN